MRTTEHSVYLYAVVPAHTTVAPPYPDVRLVEAGDVGVIVGTTDVGPSTRINDPESDPEELAELARRHDAVVRGVMATADSVLPFRLATVLADEDAVGAFATQHAMELSEQLDHLAGTQEWGVRVSESPPSSAPVRPQQPDQAEDRPGTAYLRRRRDAIEESKRRGGERAEATAATADHLGSLALERVAGTCGGTTLLDESYLVRDAQADRFMDAAHRAAEDLQALDLRLRLTGPWPPYSFAPPMSEP